MAFLTAARETIDAAVAYHGGETEQYLDESSKITAPMLMHLTEEDEFISREAQTEIKSALSNKANVVIYSYPGCNHAFARHSGTRYNAEAAATTPCTSSTQLPRKGVAGVSINDRKSRR
jgi:carboxymethylenebutenolidase